MSRAPVTPVYRELPIDRIDPPAHATRETFDEHALVALAESIRRVGLIQAIGVRPIGDRFQVIYGHRRYLACLIAELPTIACRLVEQSDISPEALKVIENAEREEVNAGEEAKFFEALLTQECGGDTDALAALVHRTREYVETRLLLLAGDPDVLAGVKANRITFSVGRELNAIRNDRERRMYLDSALRNGCSTRLARDWRIRANTLAAARAEEPAPPSGTAERPPQPAGSPFECLMCGAADEPHDMGLYYIHNYCFKAIVRPFLRGLNADPDPAKP